MLQTNQPNGEVIQVHERVSERTVLESSTLKEIVESLSSILLKLESLKEAEVDQLLKIYPETFPAEGVDFYSLMELYEKTLIEHALRQTHGNQTRAAKLLNIQLSTLNKKIKRHRIQI